jgi:hypothetical protein
LCLVDADVTLIPGLPLIAARTTDDRTQVPRVEREELMLRIDELREALRHTRSEDVRVTLQATLAECRKRLAELNEILGTETT